jgi:LytTr DNA-binding domain-containing protein
MIRRRAQEAGSTDSINSLPRSTVRPSTFIHERSRADPVMWDITMKKLKMSSAEPVVSNSEGDSDSLVDDMVQHSCATFVIARERAEPTAGSTETLTRLQAFAKSQSPRVAVKITGRILFMNLADVVSVQAKGKCVYLQRKASTYLLRESISNMAEKLETHGFIRIHRSVLVNTSFVEEIRPLSTGEYSLRVDGGKEYTVTRTYKKNLKYLAEFWIGTGAFPG